MASGITAIAGFGVLMFSSITMLRDFGFITLIDLTVSLTGVMLILPAVLALAERGQLAGSVREWAAGLGRPCPGSVAGKPGHEAGVRSVSETRERRRRGPRSAG